MKCSRWSWLVSNLNVSGISLLNNVSINYQVDYWGLSSIQAIRKILNYENNKSKVRIANASYVSLWRSLVLLDKDDKNRIEFVGQDYKNADYIFTNFNSEVNMRLNSKYSIPKNFQLVDSLYVNKIKVYDIYKKIKWRFLYIKLYLF